MSRIVIVGGPGTGKTTLALALGSKYNTPIKHTDSLIDTMGWSEVSTEVSRWFDLPGPWLVEGVATVRALRKWLQGHSSGTKPADIVIFLGSPQKARTAQQRAMATGCDTIWQQVEPGLLELGVEIYYDSL